PQYRRLFHAPPRRTSGPCRSEGSSWQRPDAGGRFEGTGEGRRQTTPGKRIYHQLHSRNRIAVPSTFYNYDQTDRQVRKNLETDSGEALNMAEPKLLKREIVFKGSHVQLRVDRVIEPSGHEATREIVVHPGAVCIVARPSEGEVLLIRQYRHSTGGELLEIPAG